MPNRDDLEQLWCGQTLGPPPKGEDMLAIAISKTDRFDRRIRTRNLTECVAAAAVAVLFAIFAIRVPDAFLRAGNLVIAASGLWILFYILKYGREAPQPAPDQSIAAFERALARKYQHQIRLLKSVKYWYLLPPYTGLLLLSAGMLRQRAAHGPLHWVDFIPPAIYTAVYAGVWWLNEAAARRLEREREVLLGENDERPNSR